jgi:Glycosyltransferases, probably involved in cell wall biogenesis
VFKSGYFPTTTLVIAAYKEESVIGKKLENSLALDYPPGKLQIMVAVDGDEDNTVAIVKSYQKQGVDLDFSSNRRGKVLALSSAIKNSRGEIIVISDSNNIFEKSAIKHLVSPFSDLSVGAVTGAKVIRDDGESLSYSEGLYWKYESFIKNMETRFGNCTAASGEIIAFRKELYSPPQKKGLADDFYIITSILKMRYRVVYSQDAVSIETVSQKEKDEKIRRSRMVAQRCQAVINSGSILPLHNPFTVWQIISHKYLRLFLPIGMFMAFTANLSAFFINSAGSIHPLLTLSHPYAACF